MRFLTSFLTILIFFVVLAGVGFYFTREYLLYRGTENFKKEVLVLRSSSSSACNNKVKDLLGVTNENGTPSIQIRFTSDTKYLMEVICPGYAFDPVVLQQGELDSFVSKVPGSSGILLGTARTGLELVVFKDIQKKVSELFGREIPYIQKTRSVVLENSDFIVVQPGETLGSGPLTSCEGYGYQCCQAETQIGVGNKIEGLQSCEKTCFSSCASRPYVLSFTSNPFFNVKDRSVEIKSGESIDFSYVIDQGTSESVQVFLDYGDGRSDQSLEKNGMLSHSYQCVDECEYTAQIEVTDAAGVESAWTQTSHITVKVTQ
jgi:hypothetical protein